jgi:Uma2 family endonuclease
MSTATRITVAEFDRMIAEGKFEGGLKRVRIELIEGELRDMSPIGPPHEEAVDVLNERSMINVRRETVRVRVQNSIGIPELDSAPEPDIAWVRRKTHSAGRPLASDIFLVIEVADSSLSYDRGEKANLFAAAEIADYWVVNIPDQCVEVFRRPESGRYGSHEVFKTPAEIRPLAFPEVALPVKLLFPSQST